MNKKGIKKIGEWITHLVFLLLVIAIFFSLNTKIKDSRFHDMNVEARDYALLRDTVLFSPTNLEYQYIPRENITINLNEEDCSVLANHKEAAMSTTFYCGMDKTLTLNEKKLDGKIKIIK